MRASKPVAVGGKDHRKSPRIHGDIFAIDEMRHIAFRNPKDFREIMIVQGHRSAAAVEVLGYMKGMSLPNPIPAQMIYFFVQNLAPGISS